MAYIQKDLPSPNEIKYFSLKNFNGGLNNRTDQLKDSEASDLLNMDFADDTLMEKRKGQEYFDDFVMDNNNAIVFIDEFKPYDDTDVLIRASNNKLYIEDMVLTDLNGKPHATNFQGKYIFCDGSKTYVYGHFHQEDSTYREVKGDPIDDYVLLEIVSPAENHDTLETHHTEGVLVVDYDEYKIYYEPCQLEIEDNYKGVNSVPENINYCLSHNGRLYLSGSSSQDDTVFISDVHNPYYFPSATPIQLPPNSDEIVGLIAFDNSVVVGRTQDIHAIFGNTNNPDLGIEVFNLHRLNSHTGFVGQDAVVKAHNYLFFFGSDGNAYSLGSTRIDEKQLSTKILSRSIDVEKKPIHFNKDDFKEITSIFYDDKWYVSLKDKVLVYSYKHMAWTMWDNFYATSWYVYDNYMIWGRSDGRTAMFSKYDEEVICEYTEVPFFTPYYLDFGHPYEAYWYSKYFDMGSADTYKFFRECFVIAHTFESHNSIIDFTFEIDYQDTGERASVINNVSKYGISKWGDKYVIRTINASIPIFIGRRGRYIRFKFTNGFYIDDTLDNYSDLKKYEDTKEGIAVKVIHAGASGTSDSTRDDELTDEEKHWEENEFAGARVLVVDGNEEYYRFIKSNTTNTIKIDNEWNEGYSSNLSYEVQDTFYMYLNGEWVLMDLYDINQRMKIHQINGDYELRRKK